MSTPQGLQVAAVIAGLEAVFSIVGVAVSETVYIEKTIFYISMGVGIAGAVLMGFVVFPYGIKLWTFFGATTCIATAWMTVGWAKLMAATIGVEFDRAQIMAVAIGCAACLFFWASCLWVLYETLTGCDGDCDCCGKPTGTRHSYSGRSTADVESPASAAVPPPRQTMAATEHALLQQAIADCTQRLLTDHQLREACRRNGLSDAGGAADLANRLVVMLGIESVQRNIPIWSKIPFVGEKTSTKAKTRPAKRSASTPGVLFPAAPRETTAPSPSPPASDSRSTAKKLLLEQSTYDLMEVSRAFFLGCSADDAREAIAEKILDALGPDTVLAEFSIPARSSPGGSSSKGPSTPSPSPAAPPAAADPSLDSRPPMECTICLEGMGPGAKDVGVAVKCGHSACFGCLTTAVRVQRKCPICRKPMAVTDIIKLYV